LLVSARAAEAPPRRAAIPPGGAPIMTPGPVRLVATPETDSAAATEPKPTAV